MVANRTTGVPANGQPAATVTVTLLDNAGQPMRGKNVALAAVPADVTTTITPHSTPPTGTPAGDARTDSTGQAVFDVADNSTALPHSVTYQATDASDSPTTSGGSECTVNGTFGPCTIAQTATISFSAGGASITATPSSVVGDGNGSSTVKFTLTDSTGAIVPNATVTLSKTSATASIVAPASTTTDATGSATWSVKDTAAEVATFTATSIYATTASACPSTTYSGGLCTVTIPVKVTFIPAPNQFTLTATPSSVLADGSSTSKVVVTALDVNNKPIIGLPLRLVPGAHNGTITGTDQTTTDFNGQATFNVADTNFETVNFTAQYLSDTWHGCLTPALCGNVNVNFIETEAQASTIVASPASPNGVPADGVSTIGITVTLKTGNQNLGNHSVVLVTNSATTHVAPNPVSNIGGTTNSNGVVAFTITDTKAEPLTVYVRDLTNGVILNNTASITFLPTESAVSQSTITANPTSLAAGGGRTTAIVVTLHDSFGAPLSNHQVTLITGSATTSDSGVATTNAGGQAFFTLSDTTVEILHVGARDTTAGVTLDATVTVSFTASEANQSTVTINPITTPAKGPAATLTVVLKDANGNPISGHPITVLGATATTTVTPLLTNGVTDVNGRAQWSVYDTAVEQETLSAKDGATLLDQTATIQFIANEANQSLIGAVPASLPAAYIGGFASPTSTVTVTLLDRGGAPINGHSVSLSSTSANASVTPAMATSDASGHAVFTVGDPVVESTVLTALDHNTGVTVNRTVTVTFTANEQNQSTATALPTLQKVKKDIIITVNLKSATGASIAGHHVALTTGSTQTTVTTLTKPAVTTAAGQIQLDITDQITETLTIKVTDTDASVSLYKPVVISFYRP